MKNRLPQYIDPLHLAENHGFISGQIPLSGMLRLQEKLFNDAGHVDVSLSFSKDGKLAKIDGQIISNVPMVCQNCLELVEWLIDSEVKLGIVLTLDEAKRLPEDYEPLLVEDGVLVYLNELVEDELLLSLPDYPKHQHNCLLDNQHIFSSGILTNNKVLDKNKPFSVLASLKNSGDL